MNINYQAPCNPMGYGVTGLQLALALNRLDHNVAWWFIGPTEFDPEYKTVIDRMVRNCEFFDVSAPSLKVWHQFEMASRIGRGVNCGLPIFELDEFTQREIHHLDSLDKIFVCSRWAMNVVNNMLPHRSRDTYITPLGVDRLIFNETIGCPQKGWVTFLNIGKWEVRKGHDILIDAFNKAFEQRDRVRLWMMNDNPHLSPAANKEWRDKYTNTKMSSHISFLERVRSQAEVAEIMGDAHCGVFPARAEGWNLELLEMMSMGKHVITTDYSAHTQYCNKDNARLIKVDNLEPADDGVWFSGEGRWARMGSDQIDQLVYHMRKVYNDVRDNNTLNTAGIETAKAYSWKAAAARVAKCLEMDGSDR